MASQILFSVLDNGRIELSDPRRPIHLQGKMEYQGAISLVRRTRAYEDREQGFRYTSHFSPYAFASAITDKQQGEAGLPVYCFGFLLALRFVFTGHFVSVLHGRKHNFTKILCGAVRKLAPHQIWRMLNEVTEANEDAAILERYRDISRNIKAFPLSLKTFLVPGNHSGSIVFKLYPVIEGMYGLVTAPIADAYLLKLAGNAPLPYYNAAAQWIMRQWESKKDMTKGALPIIQRQTRDTGLPTVEFKVRFSPLGGYFLRGNAMEFQLVVQGGPDPKTYLVTDMNEVTELPPVNLPEGTSSQPEETKNVIPLRKENDFSSLFL